MERLNTPSNAQIIACLAGSNKNLHAMLSFVGDSINYQALGRILKNDQKLPQSSFMGLLSKIRDSQQGDPVFAYKQFMEDVHNFLSDLAQLGILAKSETIIEDEPSFDELDSLAESIIKLPDQEIVVDKKARTKDIVIDDDDDIFSILEKSASQPEPEPVSTKSALDELFGESSSDDEVDRSITDPFESELKRFPDEFDSENAKI